MHFSPNQAPSLDFSRPLPPRSQGHCQVACGLGNALPSIRIGLSCFSCAFASSPSRGYWPSALAIHFVCFCSNAACWKACLQKDVRVDCNACGDSRIATPRVGLEELEGRRLGHSVEDHSKSRVLRILSQSDEFEDLIPATLGRTGFSKTPDHPGPSVAASQRPRTEGACRKLWPLDGIAVIICRSGSRRCRLKESPTASLKQAT